MGDGEHIHDKFDSARGWWDCPSCYPKYAEQADDRVKALVAAIEALEERAKDDQHRIAGWIDRCEAAEKVCELFWL